MKTPLAIFCVICYRPIEIGKAKYVDENLNPVHEPCYEEQATKKLELPIRF
jgi:hypothetical protein